MKLFDHPLCKTMQKGFWEKVDTSKPDGCWEWVGGASSVGYGRFGVWIHNEVRKTIGAHQASWILHRGPIPKKMLVCHKCDNPLCIRPDHLFLGSHVDNAADAIAKGLRQGRFPRRSIFSKKIGGEL